jgi:hypothetical protein
VRRFDKRRRLPIRWLFAMCLVGMLALLGATWNTFVTRPAAYEALRHRGMLANARVHCTHGANDNCTLTYTYARHRHKNSYGNDYSQFGLNPYVLVLIDPEHPATMYTVHDVQRNTNTGFGVFGIFCLLGIAGVGYATFWLGRELRRFVPITDLRPEPPAGIPESCRSALLAIDATDDVLLDGRFPWRTTLRYDARELAGALAYLRERLAAVPGLDPHQLDGLSPSLAGHVRLDPEPVHERLDAVRLRVVAAARG